MPSAPPASLRPARDGHGWRRRARYREGDIAYLELLDVRRDLFQSEIDLIAAREDALVNSIDLALALGARL